MNNELWVNIKGEEKSYPIFINDESILNLKAKILEKSGDGKVLVIISSKVNWLYGKVLGFKNCEKFVLRDGEVQKNFKNYQKILDKAQKMKLTRKDTIVAIGGGVVGDIAGFVAATYMRGINFIQVPTTLLACVDSSVGGKVAVDTKFGKNLVGAFYQPSAVFINLNFLKTLNKKQFMSGLAEVIKYGFIERTCETDDNGLLDFLETNSEKILARDINFLEKIIKICIALKISVVSKDEKEQGLRKILNFGHTLGHALEKITDYKKFTHGEAIVYGMKYAFHFAAQQNLAEESYAIRANEIFRLFRYSQKRLRFNTDKLIELMQLDKKSEDGKITFILPTSKAEVIEFGISQSSYSQIVAAF